MSTKQQAKPLQEFTVLLRAVGTPVRATEMLYIAADLLTKSGRSRMTINRTVCVMVARMLDLPVHDQALEMIERVLRNLPEIEE